MYERRVGASMAAFACFAWRWYDSQSYLVARLWCKPARSAPHPPVYSFLTESYTTETGSRKGPLALYVVEPQLLLPGGLPQICSCAGQLLGPVCAYLHDCRGKEHRQGSQVGG